MSPFKTITRLFKKQEQGGDSGPKAAPRGKDRSELPAPEKLPTRHHLPFRSLGNRFIGRVSEGWRLHDCLMSVGTDGTQGVGVLTGPDSVGKTQLAVEYAHRFSRHYFGGVFWADARLGLGSVILQVAEGAQVAVDKKKPEKGQLEELWEALDDFDSPVLVVLDNFQDTSPLESWLPPDGDIHLLVIADRGSLEQYAPVQLEPLPVEEGRTLLCQSAKMVDAEADPLIDALGGSPLALILAERLLGNADYQLDDVLRYVEADRELDAAKRYFQIDALDFPEGRENEITRIIDMSIERCTEPAAKVLKAMSLLAPAPIPRRLLADILEMPITQDLEDPLSLAIDELVEKRGLASLGGAHDDPFVHRVVAAYQQTQIDAGDDVYKQVITAVRREMRKIADEKDAAAHDELAALTPHADILQARAWVTTDESIDLSSYLGWYFKRQDALRLGETYRRLALKQAEKAYEPGHPIVARSQSDLALALKDLGELEEARTLLESALLATEQSDEMDRAVTAMRRSNLALVLHDLGDLKEAKEQHRLALGAAIRAYEPGHPHIAKHQSNLALVLQELGELHEARGLHEKALAADKEFYPDGHPIISRRQCNLALVLRDMGDLDGARVYLEAALEADEASNEMDPQDLAVRQCTLALVLKDLKRLDEARALAEKAYTASLEALGPDHQNTLIFKNFLDSVP